MKKAFSFLFVSLLFVTQTSPLHASLLQQAVITDYVVTEQDDLIEHTYVLELNSAPNKEITITQRQFGTSFNQIYKTGETVLLQSSSNPLSDETDYTIIDRVRTQALFAAALLFAAVVIAVGSFHGIRALVGLAISFLIIVKGVLPLLLAGYNPILVAVISSLFIAGSTFYLSHGFSRKTSIALVSTVISLTITSALAHFFIEWANLSGSTSDEVAFLIFGNQASLDLRGLLLAGIIIGALGVLDDITISQASVVQQLKAVNKNLSSQELFLSAMAVGRDHIASLINTLILVYTSASLPLLLLFLNTDASLSSIINYEIVSEEIIRTLLGSTGLVLAVPITTLFAIKYLDGKKSIH